MEILLGIGAALFIASILLGTIGSTGKFKFNSPIDNFLFGLFKVVLYFSMIFIAAGMALLVIMVYNGTM